jgi:hypothetical protein
MGYRIVASAKIPQDPNVYLPVRPEIFVNNVP